MLEVGIAAIGVALTFGLFHLISVSWPRLYYGPSDGLAIFLSSSLVKFSLFRILPVALVTSVASAYAIMFEVSAQVVATLYFAVYIFALAAFRFVRRFRFGRRVSFRDAMWLLVASVFTLLGSSLGLVAAPLLEPLLPRLSVSRDALFTALLVAVVLAFMGRVMLDEDITEKAIHRAIVNSRPLTLLVEAEARRRGVPRWLISAIIVSEQMQRPKWFQSLEGLAYSAGLPVTVGPFQGARRPSGQLVDQVAEFMEASPAVGFAMQVELGEDWAAERVERAIYALHNDAIPFVDLCQRVRELLIEDEFHSTATSYALDVPGVEFGSLRLRAAANQEFTFRVHLRSDFGRSLRLFLCKADEISTAMAEELTPGGTLERRAYGLDVDSEWVFRIVGDGATDKTFRPIRDLEFKASWDG